ncbi:GLE1-like protein-domain-containing protein [Cristinia sonorae]|uniref:mRNA export factor GLE1 n=1 Tax=Cristinia sonorae TaxID=1940300 RepID=A0A8K0USR0_9AGAR|nr:GLE1-like protein-domain-containing protein [Cristinia sonorae]
MRFGVPRSPSPSPVRRQAPRRRSGFGIPRNRSDLDSDSDSDTESVASSSSSSSDSFAYESESQVPVPIRQKRHGRPSQTIEEQCFMEDTIASIRLRVKYRDAYEDWEQQTRKDAFNTARQEQTASTALRRRSELQSQSHQERQLAAIHTKQMEEVQAQLSNFKLMQEQTERGLKERWDKRSTAVWSSVEKVISQAEEKVRRKLEEEAERRRAEEAMRAKLLQEKKEREEKERREQEEKRKAQEREAEALKLRKEQEAREAAQEEERKKFGLKTPLEDWQRARSTLMKLKGTPMRLVKSDRAKKSAWSAARRQMVSKVGQLNNDPQRNAGIAQEILTIMRPNPNFPEEIYFALLSSLSKAILLQTEIEVAAEKRTAINIAQLVIILLAELPQFGDIFWAKLVQRTGGWAIPVALPAQDLDGSDMEGDQAKRRKVMGYSDSEDRKETNAEYTARVAGIMRVYFQIIMTPHPKPLDPTFSMSRYWTYFARMAKAPQLLLSSVAPELLYVGLEVGGAQARHTWGAQWVKLLGMFYGGATEGLRGSKDHLIGGKNPEGISARVRVQLEIERIMASPPT